MKSLLIIVGGLIVLVVIVVAIVALLGSRLPKEHVASRSIRLHKSPSEVYAAARDFASAPAWRADVQRVEVTTRPDGRIHFREQGKHDAVNYELAEDIPAQRMVTRIVDTNLGYSGQWTYLFAAENSGTRLTITENGEVSNVLFRFMSRYILGHTATIDSYLSSLAKHFGEVAQPQ